MQFEEAEQLNVEGLTQQIINILERNGLEYKRRLVHQAYNGYE